MDNNKKIKEEISSLFETCLEQFEHITSYDGKIPQIEMDIIMGNIRSIYQQFTLLNKNNGAEANVQPQADMHASQPVVHDMKHEQKTTEKPEEKTAEPAPGKTPDSPIKKSSEETHTVLPHMQNVAQKNKNTPSVSLFDQNAEADDEDNETPTVNQRLNKSKSSENSLADKLKQNRVNDLKQAIGINEKFLFINELFEGSLNEYNNAITRLNSLTSKDEADSYIENELKMKYKWNDTSKAHSIFISLVERRFSQV